MKSAYLQGTQDDLRPEKIYMRPPRDPLAVRAVPEWSDKNCVYEVLSGIYGRVDAPRLWFLDVKKRAGWVQHSLDPCAFMYRQEESLQGIVQEEKEHININKFQEMGKTTLWRTDSHGNSGISIGTGVRQAQALSIGCPIAGPNAATSA